MAPTVLVCEFITISNIFIITIALEGTEELFSLLYGVQKKSFHNLLEMQREAEHCMAQNTLFMHPS